MIIGIAHDDHVARGLPPSPACGPEIEDVVEVDVGEQRRNHRALSRPRLLDRHDPVFEDAGPQPFLDEPDDALVADPFLSFDRDPYRRALFADMFRYLCHRQLDGLLHAQRVGALPRRELRQALEVGCEERSGGGGRPELLGEELAADVPPLVASPESIFSIGSISRLKTYGNARVGLLVEPVAVFFTPMSSSTPSTRTAIRSVSS